MIKRSAAQGQLLPAPLRLVTAAAAGALTFPLPHQAPVLGSQQLFSAFRALLRSGIGCITRGRAVGCLSPARQPGGGPHRPTLPKC